MNKNEETNRQQFHIENYKHYWCKIRNYLKVKRISKDLTSLMLG